MQLIVLDYNFNIANIAIILKMYMLKNWNRTRLFPTRLDTGVNTRHPHIHNNGENKSTFWNGQCQNDSNVDSKTRCNLGSGRHDATLAHGTKDRRITLPKSMVSKMVKE